ncbi:epimerase [Candidatus Peregrinibacteria bacterium CG11_big_fil_rev_8_21_14_0_20_46_8]|nr:MAG: epimerase [Candidatus Peregrinibacteria bacterium CG11_big_fil_rev_8_21_14_0_20_46_8]
MTREHRSLNKTILITGGAGFIGSNFVQRIFKEHPTWKIIVLDALTYAGNPENIPAEIRESGRFDFWYGSVTQPMLVDKIVPQADYIVHFAAETHVARSIFDNTKFFETDVIGTQVMMNAALENKKLDRFIHISTSEVYGSAEREPMDEEHPLNPTSPYAGAKCGADRLVYSYMQTYPNMPVMILRPFNNYGPRQHLEKLIARFVTGMLKDQPVRVYGDGDNSRDWLYVEDTCEAVEKALLADIGRVKGEIINLGTGRSISVMEIANIIADILEKPKSLIMQTPARPGEVKQHISSTEKAAKVLEWTATTKFEDGIVKTINWYKNNADWWKKLEWMKEVPITLEDGSVVMY